MRISCPGEVSGDSCGSPTPWHADCLQTSAKTGKNVEETFGRLGEAVPSVQLPRP
jgi:hypothetical protein